jgi:hypothetical protein
MKNDILQLQKSGWTNWKIVLYLNITRESFFKLMLDIHENEIISDDEWNQHNNTWFNGHSMATQQNFA